MAEVKEKRVYTDDIVSLKFEDGPVGVRLSFSTDGAFVKEFMPGTQAQKAASRGAKEGDRIRITMAEGFGNPTTEEEFLEMRGEGDVEISFIPKGNPLYYVGASGSSWSVFSFSLVTMFLFTVIYCVAAYDVYKYGLVPEVGKNTWSREQLFDDWAMTCDRRVVCKTLLPVAQPIGVILGVATSYEKQFEDFYRRHNKEKLEDPDFISGLAEKHKGKELRLLRKLKKKYNANALETEEEKRQRIKQERWDQMQAEKKARKKRAREKMEEAAKNNFAEELDGEDVQTGRQVQFEKDEEDEIIDLDDEDEDDGAKEKKEL